jgi:RNA polymerase sigma-70 factor (ECF subfamily)
VGATARDEADEVWMERFVQGQAEAFDVLFARHAGAVRRCLARMVGPAAADDLTQTTFLSLVRARGRYHPGAPFKPWLFAIATNAARDHLRRRRPEDLTADGAPPRDVAAEPGPQPDPGLERQVRAALDRLPGAQREAILLHRFEGLSFAEIAQTLGVSESAVKVRAHRGYLRLRELLHGLRGES